MSNPVERIQVSVVQGDYSTAWVSVTRQKNRRYSATWTSTYYHVTPASLARAQRAQVAMAERTGSHG